MFFQANIKYTKIKKPVWEKGEKEVKQKFTVWEVRIMQIPDKQYNSVRLQHLLQYKSTFFSFYVIYLNALNYFSEVE